MPREVENPEKVAWLRIAFCFTHILNGTHPQSSAETKDCVELYLHSHDTYSRCGA
jgi:hypothetical protein